MYTVANPVGCLVTFRVVTPIVDAAQAAADLMAAIHGVPGLATVCTDLTESRVLAPEDAAQR